MSLCYHRLSVIVVILSILVLLNTALNLETSNVGDKMRYVPHGWVVNFIIIS